MSPRGEEDGALEHDPGFSPQEIGLQATGHVSDLEDCIVAPGRPDGKEHAVEPGSAALVLDDDRLASVPHLAVPLEGHAGVASKEVRVDARGEAPVQQSDSDDFRLLDDQVLGQALDVGQRAAPERVLHGEPYRGTGHVHSKIEVRSPLCALLPETDVRGGGDDEDHWDQKEEDEAESQSHGGLSLARAYIARAARGRHHDGGISANSFRWSALRALLHGSVRQPAGRYRGMCFALGLLAEDAAFQIRRIARRERSIASSPQPHACASMSGEDHGDSAHLGTPLMSLPILGGCYLPQSTVQAPPPPPPAPAETVSA